MHAAIRVAVLAAACAGCVLAATGNCADTEADRLNWARERMYPGSEDLRLVYRWLDNATKSCSTSGDLWYYRALVADQLKDIQDAGFARRKAAEYKSGALRAGFNPFSGTRRGPLRRIVACARNGRW